MTDLQPTFVVPYPTRLEKLWIEGRVVGSKGLLLQAKRQTISHFKLDQLPPPKAEQGELPGDQKLTRYVGSVHRRKLDSAYRIAHTSRGPGLKPLTSRIGFIGPATLQTLQIITDHLNDSGVDWLWLTNANGARLPQRCFSSRANFQA